MDDKVTKFARLPMRGDVVNNKVTKILWEPINEIGYACPFCVGKVEIPKDDTRINCQKCGKSIVFDLSN